MRGDNHYDLREELLQASSHEEETEVDEDGTMRESFYIQLIKDVFDEEAYRLE